MPRISDAHVLVMATNRFEESELFGPREILLEKGARVTLAALDREPIMATVHDDPGRTIAPDLKGVRTWDRAVTIASGADEWIAALRAAKPEPELREWALAQTARAQSRPLWERLEALGIESGRLGSERVSSADTR